MSWDDGATNVTQGICRAFPFLCSVGVSVTREGRARRRGHLMVSFREARVTLLAVEGCEWGASREEVVVEMVE